MAQSDEYALRWTYPVHVVVAGGGAGDTRYALIIRAAGKNCVLAYRHRELAELYLEWAADHGGDPEASLDEMTNPDEFRAFLSQIESDVDCIAWDTVPGSGTMKVIAVRELLESLD